MSARLIVQLQARAAVLARRAVQAVQRRVALRWGSKGRVDEGGDTLRVSGPGLIRRRRGTRQRLPDPTLLWPGDE